MSGMALIVSLIAGIVDRFSFVNTDLKLLFREFALSFELLIGFPSTSRSVANICLPY